MISYHLAKDPTGRAYARGFKIADTDDVERLKRGVSAFVWSPCIWRDGVRRQENFLRADWLVLDFDSGEMTLKEAVRLFCDRVHIVGTTRSHGKEKGGYSCDRFRVLLKFEEPVTDLRNYRYTMLRAVRRYPVDRQPKDGARFFFPCTEIIAAEADGYTEDALTAPESFERPNLERAALYRRSGTLTPRARWALVNVIPVGERNTTWYWTAKELTRIGVTPEDIIIMIVNSATYAGRVGPDLVREIERCVLNGAKSAEKELSDDDRRQEHAGAGETEGYQNQ